MRKVKENLIDMFPWLNEFIIWQYIVGNKVVIGIILDHLSSLKLHTFLCKVMHD